jgi:hypothetical protein
MRRLAVILLLLGLVGRALAVPVPLGYRLELDSVEIHGETYYIATIYGDITPDHPSTPPADGKGEEMYLAGKRIVVHASQHVMRREKGVWQPELSKFLENFGKHNSFGLQGHVIMAAFKKGDEGNILQTNKYAYSTLENPLLPYQRGFDSPGDPVPPVHVARYTRGDVPSRQTGAREDIEHAALTLPDLEGPQAAELQPEVPVGGAMEWGAWVKSDKPHVDLMPVMLYLAERKGLDQFEAPVREGNQVRYAHPEVLRGWCPPELVSYYAQFGFHYVRDLVSVPKPDGTRARIVLIEATRKDYREGIRRFIAKRVAANPELQNIALHLGIDKDLDRLPEGRLHEKLVEALLGKDCKGYLRLF